MTVNEELTIIESMDISLENVMDIFVKKSTKIIYVVDNEMKYVGCITLGNVLKYTLESQKWVNINSKRVIHNEDEEVEVKQIFDTYNYINYIPVIEKETGKLLYEFQSEKRKTDINNNRLFVIENLKEFEKRLSGFMSIDLIFLDLELEELWKKNKLGGNIVDLENKGIIETIRKITKRTILLSFEESNKGNFIASFNKQSFCISMDKLIKSLLEKNEKLQQIKEKDLLYCLTLFGYDSYSNKSYNLLIDTYKNLKIVDLVEYYFYDGEGITIDIITALLERIREIPNPIKKELTAEKIIDLFANRIKIKEQGGYDVYFTQKTIWTEKVINCYEFKYKKKKEWYLNNLEDICTTGILVVIENVVNIDSEKKYQEIRLKTFVRKEKIEAIFAALGTQFALTYLEQKLQKKEISFFMIHDDWGSDHPFLHDAVTTENWLKRSVYDAIHIRNGNIESFLPFLEQIYEKKVDEHYIKTIMEPSLIIEMDDNELAMQDKSNLFYNVFNGIRLTTDQPEDDINTVYLIGNCIFLGYAVEDKQTVPSYLQRIINKKLNTRWRVVNLGGNFSFYARWNKVFSELKFRKGDVVVFLSNDMRILDIEERKKIDITEKLSNFKPKKEFYFDNVRHPGPIGYEIMAEKLYEIIEEKLSNNPFADVDACLKEVCMKDLQNIDIDKNEGGGRRAKK